MAGECVVHNVHQTLGRCLATAACLDGWGDKDCQTHTLAYLYSQLICVCILVHDTPARVVFSLIFRYYRDVDLVLAQLQSS